MTLTLAQLIERALPINEEQLTALESILTHGQRQANKLKIRSVLKNKFYSSFSETEFAKEVQVLPFNVLWEVNKYKRGKKLAKIREHLLRETE
jgi:hypothetical protein